MNRLSTAFLFLFAALCTSAGLARAQELSAAPLDLRVSLTAESKIVSAGDDVVFHLVVRVLQDQEIDAALLTAVHLDVTVEGQAGTQIRDGQGDGKVAVVKDTVIERQLRLPVDRLAPAGVAGGGMTDLAIAWPGIVGANCMLQITPDMSKIAVEDLDLQKTRVVLVTNFGEMTVAFYPDRAPGTVANFVKLAKDGFYNGTRFHRVLRNFMIQGGDPLTQDPSQRTRWGQGDPGYKIKGEVNSTKHDRGVLSMANSGSPDTAGSQFFICHKAAPHLNQGYTAFAALEDGLETLDRIADVPVGPNAGGERSQPLEEVVLYRAVVLPVLK